MLDESFVVKCPDNSDVLLVCSHLNTKNKFKLLKMNKRGNPQIAGRPKKVINPAICDKAHVEVVTEE